MEQRERAPTQKDIARRAGVSQRAVAAVVGNSRPDSGVKVGAAARERIQLAARELGYRPHRGAQLMRGVKPKVIGMIKTATVRQSELLVANCFVRRVRERGYGVQAHELLWGTREVARAIQNALDLGMEGVVFQGGMRGIDPAHRRLLESRGIPVVSCTGTPQPGFPYYGADVRAITAEIVDLLVSRGRRRPVMVRDDTQETEGDPLNWERLQRRAGFLEGLARNGLEEEAASWVVLPRAEPQLDEFEPGRIAADRILTMARRPDAVVVPRDAMAVGLMAELAERGVDVPGDIAVVGFGDEPMGRHVRPALTTVAEDFEEIADRAAADLLAAANDNRPLAESLNLSAGRLVIRASS